MAQPNPIQQANPTLNTKEISDLYVKKNFENLTSYFAGQNQLLGFRFFDQTFTKATSKFLLAHGFAYIPQDIITTKITGKGTVIFNYGLFDKTNINLTATDACRIRFFVGSYWNLINTGTDDPTVYTAQAALPSSATTSLTQAAFVNPMTTYGDMIYGIASGAAARLPAGSSGQFLQSQGTTLPPIWVTQSASAAASTINTKYVNGTNYTVLSTDNLIICSGVSCSITLPLPVEGKQYTIKHAGLSLTQKYTILTPGKTIDGVASGSYILCTNNEFTTVTAASGNWSVTGRNTKTGWISLGAIPFSSTSSYVFTLSAAASCIQGDVYHGGAGNDNYYTVTTTTSSSTSLTCSGTGKSGVNTSLSLVSGTGPAVLTFTGVTVTGVPSINGSAAVNSYSYLRDGSYATLKIQIRQASAGVTGAGDYVFRNPSGMLIDSSIVPFMSSIGGTILAQNTAQEAKMVGTGTLTNGTAYNYNGVNGYAYTSSSFRIALFYWSGAAEASQNWGASGWGMATTNLNGNIELRFPVSDWQP